LACILLVSNLHLPLLCLNAIIKRKPLIIAAESQPMKNSRSFAATIAALLAATSLHMQAATYYIDFEKGDNSADGLSAASAWKHAPGDSAATGKPAEAVLQGGDVVLFKGGVTYLGSLNLSQSGTPEARILYDGNSGGKFGRGAAVIDGGRIIDNWQRFENAAAVGGNSRWQQIFYADIDLDISPNFTHGQTVAHRQESRNKMAPWQRIILYDGERRLLPIAMQPKPGDDFYPDLPGDFMQSPVQLEKRDGKTFLTDEDFLAGKTAAFFEDMFVGIHVGNNHVRFALIEEYLPETKQLKFATFKDTTYPQTKYALYNSPRLIENPGEWVIANLGNGKTRFYLLPEPGRLVNGKPDNIGFPELQTGITVENSASHIEVRGFLIQRFSGADGGVSIKRMAKRSRDIVISGCEIRFISGHAGIGPHYADQIKIENCFIHHCPSWTSGIFLNRINDYEVLNNRLEKNSGSGIRHYECKRGLLKGNIVLDHFGMHSSGINIYEGCADLVLEDNYVQNTLAINRNAENIVFRNNVIDCMERTPISIAIWTSGSVGGKNVRNLTFENNTFVNPSPDANWGAGIFFQGGASGTSGITIRDNVMDRLRAPVPANSVIEGNIYLRATDEKVAGNDSITETNLRRIFRDPARGDFRRAPGGPLPKAGASLPPPPAVWQRP